VDQHDFQLALAWAAMTTMEHPLDAKQPAPEPSPMHAPAVVAAIPSVRRSAKDLVKGVLYRYPRLYDAAIRYYARTRR